MKINELDFKNTLKEEALNIGIELTNRQLENFEKYKELLIEWNEKMNLTAITTDYDVIMKHFVDCLEIIKYIEKGSKVIDVGTGAGFPGVVIAIYFENDINITLLDSLNKRLIFLEEVIKTLDLKHVNIVHARAEEYIQNELIRESYDVVVSRAVAPLNILLEYDIPYLKVGKKALFLKGNNVKEEIEHAKNALSILHSEISNIYTYKYTVGEEEYNRNVLEIIKKKETNKKYPRNYGKIKKQPL